MIKDTMSFTFIIFLNIIIFATAFATKFDTIDDEFTDLISSMRYLFDAMVTNFEYKNYGNWHRAFSVMIMAFILISTIFLLNYLIAVIDSIYTYM